MTPTTAQQVLDLVRQRGMVRACDLTAVGLSPTHLQRLYEQGLLLRSGRGIYLPADAELDENDTLTEVALRVPAGVLCLLTALQFHRLTTQLPHQVWVALPPRAHTPRLDYPPLRVVRLSGEALTAGIEEHASGKGTLRLYGPAKTVADCFKFRHKIGLDVALEALQDGWRKQRFTMDALWHYARVCRVANVMRPYVESLVS
ncbi:MAG: type IV toxin-antitoxin system AbiEi family antitoxin domain-containing protein [Armatimonadetes bacterium]|nr:type IV toxin-antitoxin system AbiEi family antitoxin domain-containing protein [Armatimonadota bacterium]